MSNALCVDDDVFTAVRDRAQRRRVTLSKAVSRCVRDSLRAVAQPVQAPVSMRSKYSVLLAQEEMISAEQVRCLTGQKGICGTANGPFSVPGIAALARKRKFVLRGA